MIEIIIQGNPISKARPRARIIQAKGKKPFVSVYDSQKKESDLVKEQIKAQFNSEPFLGCLRLVITFYIQRPKSHYGTGKNSAILKPKYQIEHTKKPDIDNLSKFIMDCMNGIVYKDDSQIYNLSATKMYGEPRTEIILT